jgi:hypothetical protein
MGVQEIRAWMSPAVFDRHGGLIEPAGGTPAMSGGNVGFAP